MKYKYLSDIKVLGNSLNDLKNYNNCFYRFNDIRTVRVRKKDFICKSAFYKAKGIILLANGSLEIELKIKYNLRLKILFIFVSCFLLGFTFANKVTINNEFNPSLLKRIGFVSVFALAFTPLFLFFWSLKKRFKEKIIYHLNLQQIDI